MVLFRMLNCQRVALWLRQRQESPPGTMRGGQKWRIAPQFMGAREVKTPKGAFQSYGNNA